MTERTNYFGFSRAQSTADYSADGFKFGDADRVLLDTVLKILATPGDGENVGTDAPDDAPTAAQVAANGTLRAESALWYGYTYVDPEFGLESTLSPELAVVTPDAIDAPPAPTLTPLASGGSLAAGVYQYVLTSYVGSPAYETSAINPGTVMLEAADGDDQRITVTMPDLLNTGTLLLSDSFDRSPSTDLDDTDGGGLLDPAAWIEVQDVVIVDDEFAVDGASGDGFALLEAGSRDVNVSAQIGSAPANGQSWQLAGRVDIEGAGTSVAAKFTRVSPTSVTIILSEMEGITPTSTTVTVTGAAASMAAGATLQLVISGTTATALVNGAIKATLALTHPAYNGTYVALFATDASRVASVQVRSAVAPTTGFNVYRRRPGSVSFFFVQSVPIGTASWTDVGITGEDCDRFAPRYNTITNAYGYRVTIPSVPSGFTWRLYRTFDHDDWSNSLIAEITDGTLHFDDTGDTADNFSPPTVQVSVSTPVSASTGAQFVDLTGSSPGTINLNLATGPNALSASKQSVVIAAPEGGATIHVTAMPPATRSIIGIAAFSEDGESDVILDLSAVGGFTSEPSRVAATVLVPIGTSPATTNWFPVSDIYSQSLIFGLQDLLQSLNYGIRNLSFDDDVNLSAYHTLSVGLGANVTGFTHHSGSFGDVPVCTVFFVQDATGGRTVDLSSITWPGDTPEVDPTPHAVTPMRFTLFPPTGAVYGEDLRDLGGSGGGGVGDPELLLENDVSGTGSYTLELTDADMVVAHDDVIVIPPNGAVAFPVGTMISFYGLGTDLEITAGMGVTLRSPLGAKVGGLYGTISARKRDTNEWVLAGWTKP